MGSTIIPGPCLVRVDVFESPVCDFGKDLGGLTKFPFRGRRNPRAKVGSFGMIKASTLGRSLDGVHFFPWGNSIPFDQTDPIGWGRLGSSKLFSELSSFFPFLSR